MVWFFQSLIELFIRIINKFIYSEFTCMGSSRLKSRRRQDLGSKWARVAIAILSTVGVIDTGSITLNKWGLIGNLNCPGGLGGCDKVLIALGGT